MAIDWGQVRFFKRHEFDSKGDGESGTGDNMQDRVVFMVDALRGLIGRPFDINSGYRTVKHNRSEGGAPKSAHLTGEAVDIGIKKWTKQQKLDLITYARKIGFNGIGVGATFIHIDVKPRVASWRYTATGQVPITVGEEYKWL